MTTGGITIVPLWFLQYSELSLPWQMFLEQQVFLCPLPDCRRLQREPAARSPGHICSLDRDDVDTRR